MAGADKSTDEAHRRAGGSLAVPIMSAIFGLVLGLVLASFLGLSNFRISTLLASIPRYLMIYVFSAGLTVLALFPIVWPILNYRRHGQEERIERIRSFYSPEVIADYFNRFLAGRDAYADAVKTFKELGPGAPRDAAEQSLKEKFELWMKENFGHDRIGTATVFLTAIGAIVLFFAFEGGLILTVANGPETGTAHYLLAIKPDITSLAAIFGAYTWITSDAIFRYRQGDFNSSDIFWYSLRFIVAVPLGATLAAFAPLQGTEPKVLAVGSSGPVLAFVLSMFSFPKIQQILGSFINRAVGVPGAVPDARDDTVVKLPGIDQPVADRLQAEGITTIAQIAVADPVRLSARTNFSFSLVLEFIDQAILWQSVGAKALIMREFGWTGASQVIGFNKRRLDDLDARLATYVQSHDAAQAAVAAYDALVSKRAAARETERLATLKIQPDAAADSPLREVLADAKQEGQRLDAALAEAADAKDKAAGACEAARKAAIAVSGAASGVIDDVAKKADMFPSAVSGVVDQMTRNDYAQLILRMMQVGATSSAVPETAKEHAAVAR